MTENGKLRLLAPNLTKAFPRSPRETIGGFVIAGRALDKCRAVLAETNGEYHFDCPLDRFFFDFSGVDSDAFKTFVATGATDEEVSAWVKENAKVKEIEEIVVWNNKMRYTRPCDMPPKLQVFLEGYIGQYVPKNRPVYYWFDVYDLEEQRI
jgi:hypothetical protein